MWLSTFIPLVFFNHSDPELFADFLLWGRRERYGSRIYYDYIDLAGFKYGDLDDGRKCEIDKKLMGCMESGTVCLIDFSVSPTRSKFACTAI